MSKKMTPCEKLGYKVGDRFAVIEKSYMFNVGDVAILQSDDGSSYPFFTNNKVMEEYPNGVACFLANIKPIAKLKPAKQALADAIHQNGGWRGGKYAVYGKKRGNCIFLTCKPKYQQKEHGWLLMLRWISGEFEMKPFVNWHQCILSRDEYFTAYPEQLNADVSNKTNRNFEAEMKSESEMIIKVGDWHKNGELPPVGEVVEVYFDDGSACWHEAYVIGYSIPKRSVIAASLAEKNDKLIWSSQFRPLRTERDKAIDEMLSLVEPMATYKEFAGEIYDAGYRNEVKL